MKLLLICANFRNGPAHFSEKVYQIIGIQVKSYILSFKIEKTVFNCKYFRCFSREKTRNKSFLLKLSFNLRIALFPINVKYKIILKIHFLLIINSISVVDFFQFFFNFSSHYNIIVINDVIMNGLIQQVLPFLLTLTDFSTTLWAKTMSYKKIMKIKIVGNFLVFLSVKGHLLGRKLLLQVIIHFLTKLLIIKMFLPQ